MNRRRRHIDHPVNTIPHASGGEPRADGSVRAISRVQAYRILTAAAHAIGLSEHIGTHKSPREWG